MKLNSKIQKILLPLVALSILSGCGQKPTNLQTTSILGSPSVNQYYQNGTVFAVNKVLVSNVGTNVLGGALGGALIGGLIGKNAKGALIGTVAGGALGAAGGSLTNTNENVSYETIIHGNGMQYKTLLDYEIRVGTPVEFTVSGDSISNVNVRRR